MKLYSKQQVNIQKLEEKSIKLKERRDQNGKNG